MSSTCACAPHKRLIIPSKLDFSIWKADELTLRLPVVPSGSMLARAEDSSNCADSAILSAWTSIAGVVGLDGEARRFFGLARGAASTADSDTSLLWDGNEDAEGSSS